MYNGWQLEQRVAKNEEDFKEVSETIRKELERFDQQKANDFKSTIANYFQCMMNYQQKVNFTFMMMIICWKKNAEDADQWHRQDADLGAKLRRSGDGNPPRQGSRVETW